jgi:hypothetical protein
MSKQHTTTTKQKRRFTSNALSAAATAAVAATLGTMIAPPPAAHASIRINEVMLNAPGTNSTQDFIELKSTTGGIEAFDLHMIVLEGDAGAAGGTGVIDHIIPLTGSTGANGLFLRHSFSAGPTPAPHADTAIEVAGYGHENAASTWVLVAGFTGAVGQDLDSDDDGVLDAALPWTAALDAVGHVEGAANNDRIYGAALGGADFNPNATGIPLNPNDDKPEVFAFRDPGGAMHLASLLNTASPPPVGGPYPVTNGGFTVQTGYEASPGNENNPLAAPARAWIGAAGAATSVGANWTGGAAPAAAGEVAIFDGGGASTLTLDADATAGVLSFNGGNHVIAAGGGTLHLDTVTGNAQVLGQMGSAAVDAPITLHKPTNLRVGRAATLALNNLTANGNNLTKQGIGDLVLGGSTSIVSATINVTSGSIKFSSDGTFNRVMATNSLTMSGTTSRIDLADNKLVTNTPAGAFSGGVYSGVQGMVQKGYNFSAWDGRGVALLTSMPDAGPASGVTTLAVATGAQVLFLAPGETGNWAGQTVSDATTLVMYTYAGDLNFDGLVDGADYGVIDNYVQFPGTDGYANGDFNYDGVIDGADYGLIDNTVQLQGTPIPTGAGGAGGAFANENVSAVPEPTAAAGLALLSAALLARRRRRARRRARGHEQR